MTKIKTIAFVLLMLLSINSYSKSDCQVLPANIRGIVVYPDGSTPVTELPVKLIDIDNEKILFTCNTDKNGVFYLKDIYTGNKIVVVGPVVINMNVLSTKTNIIPQDHSFIIVLPKRMPMIPWTMMTMAPIFIGEAAKQPTVVSP